jgi:hypothetical protein
MVESSASSGEPITIIVFSRNRPLYLWACLDSLYRYTRHPARFVLVDSQSDDPGIAPVIAGFQRRQMFTEVLCHSTNTPQHRIDALLRHRSSPSDYIVYVESDVAVFDTDPCWLTRMRAIMDANPELGLLGSYVDMRDFIDADAARRVAPGLDEQVLKGLIKADSPERGLPLVSPEAEVIDPFNPPGRLVMIRKQIMDLTLAGTDASVYRRLKAEGIGAGIATQVRHRHLSVLNFFDYPDYDIRARDRWVSSAGS